MRPAIFVQAIARRREEIARGEQRWYYISFATETDFLGGAVLFAYGPVDAHMKSFEMGVNPGRGSAQIIKSKEGFEPPSQYTNRLLKDKAEVEAFDEECRKRIA